MSQTQNGSSEDAQRQQVIGWCHRKGQKPDRPWKRPRQKEQTVFHPRWCRRTWHSGSSHLSPLLTIQLHSRTHSQQSRSHSLSFSLYKDNPEVLQHTTKLLASSQHRFPGRKTLQSLLLRSNFTQGPNSVSAKRLWCTPLSRHWEAQAGQSVVSLRLAWSRVGSRIARST